MLRSRLSGANIPHRAQAVCEHGSPKRRPVRSAVGHSRRYCHVRSLVRYPQHRTLPRPTEPVCLPPSCARSANNGHSRRSSCATTFARSLSASRWTRKKFASWGRKANSCARSSPSQAQKRRVLACPVLYRSGAPEEIRTLLTLQIRNLIQVIDFVARIAC
jgi:hypothetical protein